MSSLAKLPDVVGFFSYSRDDDKDSKARLSKLRDAIQRELGSQLGADKKHFRLWQDKEAIALGTLWESKIKEALDKSLFFIPIVTPRAVGSRHCKFEFQSFIERERALDRDDLVFPILYIAVPALDDEEEWRSDPVLSIIGRRQYVDWQDYRFMDVDTPAFSQEIARFCDNIVKALRKPWVSPEERRKQEETAALRRAEEERIRQEAEAKKRAEEEARRREEEAEAQRRADEERIQREGQAKKREDEEARRRQKAEAQRSAEEAKRRQTEEAEAEAARQAEEERRAREAAEVERAAREEREKREAAEAAEKAEQDRRLAEAEAARQAKEERRATAASEAEQAREEREKREAERAGAAQGGSRSGGGGKNGGVLSSALTAPTRPSDVKKWGVPAAIAGAALVAIILIADPYSAILLIAEYGSRQERAPVVELTAAQERALNAGDLFRECGDCPDMIVVPAGRFTMGSLESDPGLTTDMPPRPPHEVTIAKPFAVSKFELTFDEWDACAAHGDCLVGAAPQSGDVAALAGDSGWGRGRRPAIHVGWEDAQTYVRWLSRTTGKAYRLPLPSQSTRSDAAALHAQAQKADGTDAGAQGGVSPTPVATDRTGDKPDQSDATRMGELLRGWAHDIKLAGKAMANCDGCGSWWDNRKTAPVGSFAANRFGLYDMVGNVSEWTEDCVTFAQKRPLVSTYEGAPADGSAWTSGECRGRVVRGGAWDNRPDGLSSAYRDRFNTSYRFNTLGFRVARTLTP